MSGNVGELSQLQTVRWSRFTSKHYDFILGIQSSYAEGRDFLRLQLTTAEPVAFNQTNVLLDLDYLLAQPEAVSLEKAFDWIDSTHFHIQEAFEASITDRLRELFNA